MVTPQLVEYIKNTLGRGYAEDKVRDALVKKGWKQADVNEAFRIARGATTTAVPSQAQPVREQQAVQTPQSSGAAAGQAPQQPQIAQTAQISQTPQTQLQAAQALPATAAPVTPPRFPQTPITPQQSKVFPQSPAILVTTPPRFQQPQTPLEIRSPQISADSLGTGSLAGQAQAVPTEEAAVPAWRSWKIAYIAGGVVIVLGAYVFFGARYGLYAFGFNLFPFEDLAQKTGIALNGVLFGAKRLPNNLNIYFTGVNAQEFLIKLDRVGLAASAGPACSARSMKPSPTLRAMGFPQSRIEGSVRFTLGRGTTKQEIDTAIRIIKELLSPKL